MWFGPAFESFKAWFQHWAQQLFKLMIGAHEFKQRCVQIHYIATDREEQVLHTVHRPCL